MKSVSTKLEGFWRSHQVPMADVKNKPERLHELERWMRSYKPEDLFDERGRLIAELKVMSPKESTHECDPHANGGILKKALRMPDFRGYALKVEEPGKIEAENMRPSGNLLCEVMRLNMSNFRVFCPTKTRRTSWIPSTRSAKTFGLPNISSRMRMVRNSRETVAAMEMLSEHTIEGMLEDYRLTGRHGFFSTYEAFVNVIDSMFNQHAKWLSICNQLSWRKEICSVNFLITSTVRRQGHNSFTHEDPGFLDVVLNKSAAVTRIYLLPDANSLLSVADHCLRSEDYVNAIVCDKQMHLQYLDIDAAVKHCRRELEYGTGPVMTGRKTRCGICIG